MSVQICLAPDRFFNGGAALSEAMIKVHLLSEARFATRDIPCRKIILMPSQRHVPHHTELVEAPQMHVAIKAYPPLPL